MELIFIPTNRDFAKYDEHFRKSCELAGIQPTKRQASKYRMGKGLAYKKRHLASKA